MNLVRAPLLAAIGFFCANAAAEQGPSAPRVVAIVDATVVHPDRDGADAIRPHTTVVIEGSRISQVGPSSSTPVPKGAQVVDGAGYTTEIVIYGGSEDAPVVGSIYFFDQNGRPTSPVLQ